jgi:biotin synthase
MHQKRDLILKCRDDVINGKKITDSKISELFNIDNELLLDLSDASNQITRHFHGSKVDIEELANIKKNFCSEDCTFCSQSAFFNTKITGYELPPPKEIVEQAMNAKNDGAGSFCLVAAWREPSTLDFEKVCVIIEEINKKVGISVECSLGFLTDKQAKTLKKLQVKRYNHNLETSRSKFPEICTTHTYDV